MNRQSPQEAQRELLPESDNSRPKGGQPVTRHVLCLRWRRGDHRFNSSSVLEGAGHVCSCLRWWDSMFTFHNGGWDSPLSPNFFGSVWGCAKFRCLLARGVRRCQCAQSNHGQSDVAECPWHIGWGPPCSPGPSWWLLGGAPNFGCFPESSKIRAHVVNPGFLQKVRFWNGFRHNSALVLQFCAKLGAFILTC